MLKLLVKLFKSILNILILTSLVVILFKWAQMNQEQRQAVLVKINQKTPFDIFKLSHQVKSQLVTTVNNNENPEFRDGVKALSEFLGGDGSINHLIEFDCKLPQTREKQQTETSKVYQWRDEFGKIHFSDQKQNNNAQDLSEQYAPRENYITSHIEFVDFEPQAGLQQKINVIIPKMFLVLSDSLNITQLHQLDLSLKIFSNPDNFKSYLSEKAPQLNQAQGFYLANENEASVLIQASDYATLQLIQHEISHVIMANLYGFSPIWLNEGFAEYFQNIKVSGFETSVYPAREWLYIMRQLSMTPEYRISTHLGLSVTEWQSQNIRQHYAEAWSLVFFLLSSNTGKQVLAEYFKELAKERCFVPDSLGIINRHYPGGSEQLDSDWSEWIQQRDIYAHRY